MIALDLFAGTGWGVACQRLGIEEYGVEIMPEAIATREANGMPTIYRDVWEGLATPPSEAPEAWGAEATARLIGGYDLLIASPPCQTFSMAGGGAGRKALDDVLEAIATRAYLDPAELRAFGEKHDPRTALVLTPLAHVARDTPLYVIFEQVPPVLPVWEACADEMRRWGYSVWTGNLQAEQYGVPQTRKRAVLIARADGIEAKPPTPTHSRYYSRDPKRLDEGVLPWVSMAEALGWGRDDPATTVAGDSRNWPRGHKVNAADIARLGEEAARERYADRAGSKGRGAWAHAGAGAAAEKTAGQIPRPDDEPAHTVTGKGNGVWVPADRPRVMRSNYSGGGKPGETAAERGRTHREDDKPSLAMTGKPGHWVRPSFTVTGGGTGSTGGAEPFGPRARAAMPEGASRITVEEAAALQSYPPGFTFAGTKTKQFLQIGNAVPPLLAEAIIAATIGGAS
jgi:DNA (cytosine-5)-methyltransferase 1